MTSVILVYEFRDVMLYRTKAHPDGLGKEPDYYIFDYLKIDELVKSRISDIFVKSTRSRLANPEE